MINEYSDPLEQMLAREDEAEAERLASFHESSSHVTRPPISYEKDTYEFISAFADDNHNFDTYT